MCDHFREFMIEGGRAERGKLNNSERSVIDGQPRSRRSSATTAR